VHVDMCSALVIFVALFQRVQTIMRAQYPCKSAAHCVEHCTSVPLCTISLLQPLLRHPDLCPSVAVISCPADDRSRRESSQIVCMLVLVTGGTAEAVVRLLVDRGSFLVFTTPGN
jgi:hypothetical protein